METSQKNESNQPTHIVKLRHGNGKQAFYERIGAAWLNRDNGSLYIKLHGTQIISEGFNVFPVNDRSDNRNAPGPDYT